jgi:HK97 family phage prohead protease
MIERRFIRGGQLRAKNGDKPGLAGVASVYNQEFDNGWFRERILPGAFKRVLSEDPDVRCLFNHNPDNVLARTKNGTLRLVDKSDGLNYEADIDPNTTIGRDVGAMVERGDVDGCSFAFSVSKQAWREEKLDDGSIIYRDIEEVDELFDVGPVTYPAYTGTSVGIRSLWPNGVPAEIRTHVPQLRSDDGEKTKRVDDEDLTRDCFLLVGDPDKTDTWELPWKFSTAAKTKSHLRDALSRFNQVEGFSEEALKRAWKKLLTLCDHYGIDVADKKMPRSKRDAACVCSCDACEGGDCAECDCEGCDSENCGAEDCRCGEERERMRMRTRLAEHS